MALAFLARRGTDFTSVRELGDRLAVPRRLLAEVLKDMARGGLVEGARGPGGGYRLVDEPRQLPLGRVVEVLEGPIQVADCTEGGNCEHEAVCGIQHGMRSIARRIKGVLDQSTLADLLEDPVAPRAGAVPPALSPPLRISV